MPAAGSKLVSVNDIVANSPLVASGGSTTTGVTGPTVTLGVATGGITNGLLQNSSVTINAGSGLSGGGTVSLGNSITLANTGVVSFNGRSGAVLPASLDYSFSQISGTAGKTQLPSSTAFTDQANSFTGNQSVAGNLNISGGNFTLPLTTGSTAGVLMLGLNPFLHGFGSQNVFVGGAGNFTMSGSANIAIGSNAFLANGTGSFNTAIGLGALAANASGNSNTAAGGGTLQANTIGVSNTAIGVDALNANTEGNNNTAVGFNALANNVGTGGAGSGNTAIGIGALVYNSTGNNNIAIGQGAGSTNNKGSNGSDNIYIGNIEESSSLLLENESNTMRIGDNTHQLKTFIGGISIATVTGNAVLVDSNGQLGVATSSRRFKYDIQDMNEATNKLLRLRPVTFRYKRAQDGGSHPLQYGLIAEEVAEVYPELVQNSQEGQPNAVLYHVLPAMLLNEFQKQHRRIEEQNEQIQSLQEQVAQLITETRKLQMEVAAFNMQREESTDLAAAALPPQVHNELALEVRHKETRQLPRQGSNTK